MLPRSNYYYSVTAILCLIWLSTAARAVSPIDLFPNQMREKIGLSVEVLHDSALLDPSEVLSHASKFKPHVRSRISFGNSRDPIWVRLGVRNASEERLSALLSSGRTQAVHLSIYKNRAGQLKELFSSENPSQYTHSLKSFGMMAAEFDLAPGEETELYLCFRARYAAWLPIAVGDKATIIGARNQEFLVTGLFSIAILAMVLLNLFYYLSTRRAHYLYYCIAQVSFVLLFAHQNALTTVFLLADNPRAAGIIAFPAYVFSAAFMGLFARQLLRTEKSYPKLDLYIRLVFVVAVLSSLMQFAQYLFFPEAVGTGLTPPFIIATLLWVLLVILGWHKVYLKGRQYLAVAIAWTLFLISNGYMFIGALLPAPAVPMEYFWGIIAFTEALLVSLALAVDVRRIDRSLLATEKDLTAALAKEVEVSRKAEQLQRDKLRAYEEQAAKSKLVLAASHDSRHMIGAIKTYSNSVGLAGTLEDAQDASDRIAMISDMLEQLQSTMIEGAVGTGGDGDRFALERIEAHKFLSSLQMIFGDEAKAKAAKLDVRTPGFSFVSDRTLLTRIISNLLGNAIKYSQAKRILLTARTICNKVRIEVWDNGCGMPQSVLENYRNNNSLSYRGESDLHGTGNGLLIARQMTMSLGGRLDFYSAANRSTVARISIPLAEQSLKSGHSILLYGNSARWPMIGQDADFQYFDASGLDADARDPNTIYVIDPAEVAPEVLTKVGIAENQVCLATFDRTIMSRSEWMKPGRDILFKPVSKQSLLLLQHLRALRTTS